MGKSEREPWTVQWHVTADGTVIQQRARGDEAHQQLFRSFATTRPVTAAELDALSARSEHEMGRTSGFSVAWWTGIAAYFVVFALAGALLTGTVSGEPVPGVVVGLVVALVLLVPAFRAVMAFLPKDDVGSVERLWHEAGLESSAGTTMEATRARALIDAPGTTSGGVTRAERV